jgi:hypothetical protein
VASILRLKPSGYIALYRSLFDHALFRDERPFTRLQAWVWLICDAAWKVEQRRIGLATVTLERGQSAATQRSLAETWGWSVGAVQRFLATLKRHGMIRTLVLGPSFGPAVTSTVPDTPTESPLRQQVTVITICSYSKFQTSEPSPKPQPSQDPIHQPIRRGQQVLDLGDDFAPQEVNKKTKGLKRVGEEREAAAAPREWPKAPAHLTVSKKHGTVFVVRGTEEWAQYAADYAEARGGTAPFPNAYNGAGRWFSYDGEAAAMQRAAQRRRRRA